MNWGDGRQWIRTVLKIQGRLNSESGRKDASLSWVSLCLYAVVCVSAAAAIPFTHNTLPYTSTQSLGFQVSTPLFSLPSSNSCSSSPPRPSGDTESHRYRPTLLCDRPPHPDSPHPPPVPLLPRHLNSATSPHLGYSFPLIDRHSTHTHKPSTTHLHPQHTLLAAPVSAHNELASGPCSTSQMTASR